MMTLRERDFFITGTDTEIGKTFCSSALLQAFSQQGASTLGLKPIASGAEWRDEQWHNEDVDALMAASSVQAPQTLVCPYLMQTPAAPHIVAKLEHVSIELPRIQAACEQARSLADVVIVEGVGGFCVPLNEHTDTAQLAQVLNLPVILVVGLRLGCINHALLTAQAIRAQGLTLAGWIANTVDPDMLYLQDNIAAIAQRIAAPLLGHIPRLRGTATEQRSAAAACLDLNTLQSRKTYASQ
ncbi:dethiobiotin synthase [Undibacterium crateris]|uniref:dethiobiotin synthase n=1 Tax=Undibacterium crateris TaxID=2528175 RepID=UPI0013894A91|nr:dethiobiotin synthase [Undibacterium crateris]NDI84964.1 dethiobiotin synthase [Undibacterium crateris]